MQLQGRNLGLRMEGDDVALLQRELRQLGYAIEDPEAIFGVSTGEAVRAFQEAYGLESTGVVDAGTADLINETIGALEPRPEPNQGEAYVVQGRVARPDGGAVPGVTVRAFHQGFRAEPRQLGADATSDEAGGYQIVYTVEPTRRAGRQGINLVVRAHDQQDGEIATPSAVIFDAGREETVNLVTDPQKYRGPIEYSQLVTDVTIIVGDESLVNLTETEIALLAGESGYNRGRIKLAAQAMRQAEGTVIEPEVFYALARQELPIDSPAALLRQGRLELGRALEAAQADNIIAQKPKEWSDQVIGQVQEWAVGEELKGDFGLLLQTSPLLAQHEEVQKAFIRERLLYQGPLETFWDELSQRPEFAGEGVVDALQLTVHLGEITQSHVPMVQALQDSLPQETTVRDLPDHLVRLEVDDWRELIEATGVPRGVPGEDEGEKKENYAEYVFRTVEASFPTTKIAHRLRYEVEYPPGADDLLEFLNDYPDFDLGTMNVADYLNQETDLDEAEQVQSWQRVYRMSPSYGRYEAMRALKMDGLDSAQAIMRVGRSAFISYYIQALGDEEKAQQIWAKASHISAMALTLYARYSQVFNSVMPRVIPYQAPSGQVGNPVSLEELFGPPDYCECQHCKSLYSPSAYLVDLLSFLRYPSKRFAPSPLSVLLSRRPDLAEIELSCENTDTLLPYVDVVNEVLEDAFPLFSLPPDFAIDWDHEDFLWETLVTAFHQNGVELSDKSIASVIERGSRLHIIDGDKKYLIVKEAGDGRLNVYKLRRGQTQARQDELGATPQHLNEQAYLKLAQAFYPWALPFDLWFEEARIYMQHLGFERYAWMEKFIESQSQPLRKPLDVACGHLGITERECKLITTPLTADQNGLKRIWGLETQNWSQELRSSASLFLKHAGFDDKISGQNYKALRQLFGARSYFRGVPKIRFRGDTCDLDQAEIEHPYDDDQLVQIGLIAPWSSILDITHRFLRLQRKLGWSIPELDKAITALNAGLDGSHGEKFLRQLSHIQRLRAELKVPLLEMLSWWGPMDIADDLSEEEESKKTKSLYEQVFLDKSIDKVATRVFELNDGRTGLKDNSQKITSHLYSLVAALGISTADLRRLVKENGQDDGEVPDQLNLSNLSHLYRVVSLADVLKLSVKQFLAAKDLTGIDPFEDTQQALDFLEVVRKIQASSFSIAELDYLLRHQYEETEDIAPTEAEIAQALDEIRGSLEKIEVVPDPRGDLTKEKLSVLLPAEHVDEIFEIISGKSEKSDPEQEALIDELLGPYLDGGEVKSQLVGPKALPTQAERFAYTLEQFVDFSRQNLVKQGISTALSLDADITVLLLERLVTSQIDGQWPVIRDFLALPAAGLSGEYYAGNIFNPKFKNAPVTVRIDRTVDFEWAPTPPVGGKSLSVRWQGVVHAEQTGTYTFSVEVDDQARLWVAERIIIDTEINPVAQGDIELQAGKFYDIQLEYYTNDANSANARTKLSWKTPSGPGDVVLPAEKLLPKSIMTSYRLLHKLALLITKFNFGADELLYLAEHGADFENFDLNAFPTDTSGAKADLFKQWVHLCDVFRFRDRYRQPDTRLIDVFGAAYQSLTEAKQRLAALTGWDVDQLEVLASDNGFDLSADDLKRGNRLSDLHEAFRVIRHLGISAQQLVEWTMADLGADFVGAKDSNFKAKKVIAQALKETAKAKYGRKQWPQVARPLRDELRVKQRAALVTYLVQEFALEGADDLYARFLIDVEMDPCMLTSRVKQAISSVQLFVQRILMNLEDNSYLSPSRAKEWKWRRNYRVWEANRKVLLYPENWIEPELRDDKSPFFQDLENELLQNELTDDTVKTAFLHYLEKLDEVARLEMVGMYQDEEQRTLHVFGRTRGTPHIYYYRRWVDEAYWTPWEKVDLDIEGDHLIPVVWNRRLHVFWPIFKEEAGEGAGTTGDNETPPLLEIQLAWSEYKNGRWLAKKVVPKKWPETTKLISGKKSPLREQVAFKALTFDECGDLMIHGYKRHENPDGDDYWGKFVSFTFIGCQGDALADASYGGNLLLPKGSIVHGTTFREKPSNKGDRLELVVNTKPEYQKVLYRTPYTFRILYPHQYLQFISQAPFFYQDDTRTFFVLPQDTSGWWGEKGYQFRMFYHPFVCEFYQRLYYGGIDGRGRDDNGIDELLSPEPNAYAVRTFFDETYGEKEAGGYILGGVLGPTPFEEVDFDPHGAYSLYNWELFFHTPLLIADRLSKNQRFEEAMRWFHYIFDPTSASAGPWKFRPFADIGKGDQIQDLMKLLHSTDIDDQYKKERFEDQVKVWRDYPFRPHVIARLRTVAYMKSVVMKYIDNLIAWGDQLFLRDTIESINEATQLYILAAEILGPRPQETPARKWSNLTFSELEAVEAEFDVLYNKLVRLENVLQESPRSGRLQLIEQAEVLALPTTLYFCVPNNDKLLEYWDTVEDRLFKIRHCMTIEGVVRQLPLFQPPIDPELLVRAVAAGVDISSVLNDLYAPLPHYRFQLTVQKATELCAEVRSLGSALLSALEKKDAEELALMRSRHEITLLKAVKEIKKQQIKESEATLERLNRASTLAVKRKNHYQALINNGLNANEQLHLSKLHEARLKQSIGQGFEVAAGIAHALPTETVTFGTNGKEISTSHGGPNIGSAFHATSTLFSLLASLDSYAATMASIEGSNARRKEEWIFQKELAEMEEKQINKQIAAAEIRLAIAENELTNHEQQIENAREVDAYMRDKFTNKQLYNWMVSQLSALYFQSYQMAYDLAKRAEKAFQYELGLTEASFIQFGYWDSLKKGLLAGEKLGYDLKRMEVAYLEGNRREYELTKHVSLGMLDPEALVMLRERGECFVGLPEAIFDLDYPGHYMRRIKSVGLTIPCVAGPYTGVSCTLTLLKNQVRINSSLTGKEGTYKRDEKGDDPRFRDNVAAIQSITTSSGQNDSGLFELNFRDERYLPFEGAGAISQWRLELPNDFRQFDYNTITDVILHIRYTARDGGGRLKEKAVDALQDILNQMVFGKDGERKGLFRMFSARHEFPSEWHRFFQLVKEQSDQEYKHRLKLDLSPERFPYQYYRHEITINGIALFLKLKEGIKYDGQLLVYDLKRESKSQILKDDPIDPDKRRKFNLYVANGKDVPGLLFAKPFEDKKNIQLGEEEEWWFEVKERENGALNIADSLKQEVTLNGKKHFRLNPEAVKDLWVVCEFSVTKKK